MRFLCLFVVIVLSGCRPLYVLEAAVEQVSILSKREPIDDVLQNPAIDSQIKSKLTAAAQARAFGKQLGLAPNDSFTTYVEVDRSVLSWIVMGAHKDTFELVGWWFPIVGTVPYRGFFEKQEAEEFATSLQNEGYEIWIRPTDAYSTLGWFNDPLLSTTLKRSEDRIVETILHESFHQTVWFPGEVAFNETAAHVVGLLGAIEFYKRGRPNPDKQTLAENNLRDAIALSEMTNKLFDGLQQLYQQPIPSTEKISKRQTVFEQLIAPYREKHPLLSSFHTLNNAEIMQLKTYVTQFSLFLAEANAQGSLEQFIIYLKKIKQRAEEVSQPPQSILQQDTIELMKTP